MFQLEFLEIEEKLALVKRLDKRFQVLGSDKHRYFSYSPSDSEIHSFEDSFGVKLPETFRVFLQVVGYGAGPNDGIWSFEQITNEHNYFQTKHPFKVSNPFPFVDLKEAQAIARMYQDLTMTPLNLDAEVPADGCIALQGSRSLDGLNGFYIMLVVTGSLVGTVWYAHESGDWHPALRPIGVFRSDKSLPEINAPVLFHEWYLSWLEQCIVDLS